MFMQFLSKNGKPHLKSDRLIANLSITGVVDYNNPNIEFFTCQTLFRATVSCALQLVNVLYVSHHGMGVPGHP
mgnify:FL=1